MNVGKVLKKKIENNLDMNSMTNNIVINVAGAEITLQGIVNSYDEKNQIESITWNTSGVNSVNNELSIHNEN